MTMRILKRLLSNEAELTRKSGVGGHGSLVSKHSWVKNWILFAVSYSDEYQKAFSMFYDAFNLRANLEFYETCTF